MSFDRRDSRFAERQDPNEIPMSMETVSWNPSTVVYYESKTASQGSYSLLFSSQIFKFVCTIYIHCL